MPGDLNYVGIEGGIWNEDCCECSAGHHRPSRLGEPGSKLTPDRPHVRLLRLRLESEEDRPRTGERERLDGNAERLGFTLHASCAFLAEDVGIKQEILSGWSRATLLWTTSCHLPPLQLRIAFLTRTSNAGFFHSPKTLHRFIQSSLLGSSSRSNDQIILARINLISA